MSQEMIKTLSSPQNGAEDRTRRMFIVLNPVAGNSDVEETRQTFQQIFDDNNIAYDIYETTGEEDLAQIIEEALHDNYSMVVAGGGDGTVTDAATGLVDRDVPLGILPLGTGNLVARELHIPLDLEEACQLLIDKNNNTTQLDAMAFNGKAHIPHISLGMYAQVIEETSVEDKRRFGMMAYFWNGFKEIVGQDTWSFTITVDGRAQQFEASLVILANIGTIGVGDTRWGTAITPDDGEVDVCIVRAKTVGSYLSAMWHVLNGHPKPSGMTYLKAREKITVTAHKPIPVRIGGSTVDYSTVEVEVIPQALNVIIPTETASEE